MQSHDAVRVAARERRCSGIVRWRGATCGIPSAIKMGMTWMMNSSIPLASRKDAMVPAAGHVLPPPLDLSRRVVVWPKATDKRGKEWPQPLAKAAVRALRVARDVARRQDVQSPFVLYGTRGVPSYTIQSLWKAIRHAEEKAGIPHRRQRAGHGFRRMVVGDQDARMAKHYLKNRDDEMRRAFRARDRASVVAASQAPVQRLHGRARRHPLEPGDPRLLPAPPRGRQTTEARPRGLHAEAAHHSERQGAHRHLLAPRHHRLTRRLPTRCA